VAGGETYRSAGVDLEALEGMKERIVALSRITHGPQVLGAPGGFAGMYRLDGYREPVLVSSTDGVGTKLRIAALLGHHESLGIDLVNLNVNDVLTRGARPLFFLDYMSMGHLDHQRTDSLLRGMAWACKEAGCSLIGGETAQMPGFYADDAFDLAGFVVGAVERDAVIDGSRTVEGDILVGIPSSGLHTNGFSLVRKVFDTDRDPAALYKRYDELNHTLGEALLTPHRCYYPLLEPVLPLINAMAHITGGGLVENVPRVLPQGLCARLETKAWDVPPIFGIVQRQGRIDDDEMFRVFNMGLGMVVACSPDDVPAMVNAATDARVVGEVVRQQGETRVTIE
jgi:phosphoribosylformylglycinamidine cyclo-ligase